MTTFCTDADLLQWEPGLLKDAGFASQTLIAGTASVAGATLTVTAGGSLVDSHVSPGQVVVLGGAVSGCFPIVRVTSATTMVISVLYDGLFPDAETDPAVETPVSASAVTGLSFNVRTFWPQRRVVSELLMQAAGVDSLASARRVAAGGHPIVANPQSLRRACTVGALQMIYSAVAAAAASPAELKVRAELY